MDSNAAKVSADTVAALEKLRTSVQTSEQKMREYGGELKRLKGSSDEVKRAKEELKTKILSEQQAVTKATLEIKKQGSSYTELAAKAKAAATAEQILTKAEHAHTEAAKGGEAGLSKLKTGLDVFGIVGKRSLRDVGELSEAFGGMGAGGELAASAMLGLAAGVAALTAALVAGAVALSSWIIQSANASRATDLTAEGIFGTEENAKNLADQITELSGKVPTARAELEGLANELGQAGLRGDTLVDTLNAVAQVSSAVGKEAGSKLQTALTKSLQGGQLTAADLKGTGLDLSKVDLKGGAAALRKAVEQQFGQLNSKKLLDLNAQAQHFKDTMSRLTSDVNLEPLLRAVAEISSFFDEDTVTGNAIKEIVTAIGNQLGEWAEDAAPFVKQTMKQLLIITLEAAIYFLQLYHRVRDAFGPDTTSSVTIMNAALAVTKFVVEGMLAGIVVLYGVWRVFTNQINMASRAIDAIKAVWTEAKRLLSSGWSEIGKEVISGLISGITGGAKALADAVTGLASKVKSGFTSALGIKSPSTVFAEYGRHTTEGYAQGVEQGSGRSSDAVQSMVQAPGAPASGGGGAEVHLHIHAGAGKEGGDASAKLSTPSFQAQLVKALEDLLVGQGLQVTTEPA
jgi:hypothetical protein